MKAWVLEHPNCLRFEDIPIPVCNDNEILVKIKTACICNGSDPAILSGATWAEFPVVFGHETFGEIVQCGKNVKDYPVGSLISWWFTMGAFAEYIVINPEQVAIVTFPDNINRWEAPIFELVIAAYRAVSVADVEGKDVLIVGLGPSGLIMSQLCKILGARLVNGWDLYDKRLELGRSYGCREHDGLYDVVIDAFGDDITADRQTVNKAVECLKDFGTLVSYGHPEHGRTLNTYLLQKKQIKILMPVNDITKIKELADMAILYYLDGRLDLKGLITKHIELEDVQVGLSLLKEQPGQHIKIIVKIEDCGEPL